MATKNTETKQTQTPFAVVESYNTIRTNLLFLLTQHKGKIVAVSSANEGEGKSTTSLNVAISFSQLRSKTLLIDSDMRKPSLHKKLHISNNTGLSNILVGFCKAEDAISSVNPYFDVICAGPTPPNPSELLANPAFDELIDSLKESYDYIIIDTTPINVVSDALIVSPRTDGILLVVKSRYTYHEHFRAAVSSIEFAKLRLLGVVINAIDTKNASKYKYKYKYRYRYRNHSAYRNYENSSYFNTK